MPQATDDETRRRAVRQSWDNFMDDPAMRRELDAGRDELEWFIAHPCSTDGPEEVSGVDSKAD